MSGDTVTIELTEEELDALAMLWSFFWEKKNFQRALRRMNAADYLGLRSLGVKLMEAVHPYVTTAEKTKTLWDAGAEVEQLRRLPNPKDKRGWRKENE